MAKSSLRNISMTRYFLQKEAYSDPVKRRRQDRIEKSKKNLVNKPFLPSDYSKQPSGTGSYFGTFGLNGQVGHKHFSGWDKVTWNNIYSLKFIA